MLQLQRILPTSFFSYTKPLFTRKPLAELKLCAPLQPVPYKSSLLASILAADIFQRCFRPKADENTPPVQKPVTPPLRVVRPRHKLMSYNAEQFYRSGKGKDVKPLASIKALAEAILVEEPDVLALQEVGDRKLLEDFNTKYLGGKYPNIVSIPVNGDGPMRVAMMSKANMKVVDSKSHWKEMSQGADYHGKRDLLEATFQTDSGYQFTVYNAHCKSMRGGEAATTPIRLQEVSNVAKILKAHFDKDQKAQVFVAGDFNTLPDTSHGKQVLEKLTRFTKGKEEPDLTEVMMKDGKTDPTHNGHGHHPDSKLDYIFVSTPMVKQVMNAYVAGQFDKKPWSIASDHVPYVTVFEEAPQAAQTAKPNKNKRAAQTSLPAELQLPHKKQKIDRIA
jgi:endonuclease/exonuclease/phosphatase family metal-dependent hydrolase